MSKILWCSIGLFCRPRIFQIPETEQKDFFQLFFFLSFFFFDRVTGKQFNCENFLKGIFFVRRILLFYYLCFTTRVKLLLLLLIMISYLSLNAVFLAYLWRDPSSMMNLIFWKKEAVEEGGCLWSKMSIGRATVVHSWLFLQTGLSQHSGSSQSVKPSVKSFWN